MTKPYPKSASADPPSRDAEPARPKSGGAADTEAESDATATFRHMLEILDRLDEAGRQLAEALGVPAEAVIGRKRSDPLRRQLEEACRPQPTPEQRAARKAAIRDFKRLARNSATLH